MGGHWLSIAREILSNFGSGDPPPLRRDGFPTFVGRPPPLTPPPYRTFIQREHVFLGVYKRVKTQSQPLVLCERVMLSLFFVGAGAIVSLAFGLRSSCLCSVVNRRES